jgi:predicted nucleic acid-binding protein
LIIADTGAIIALLDANDRHHSVLRALFEKRPQAWLLPWAILPEVDYLAQSELGSKVEQAFLEDLAGGVFRIDFGENEDLGRARDLCAHYASLQFGLVDAIVMATAERRKAEAIATLDLRDFGVVKLKSKVKLFPRDLR